MAVLANRSPLTDMQTIIYDHAIDWNDAERGYIDLWDSIMGFGDFARYIIGTNNQSFPWSNRRIIRSNLHRLRRMCATSPAP